METSIAERLKAAREQKNLSIDELSYEARVPVRSLYNWERGWSQPGNLEALARVADALEVSLDYLITGRHPAAA